MSFKPLLEIWLCRKDGEPSPSSSPQAGHSIQQSRQTCASNGHCSASRIPVPASPQVRGSFLACTHPWRSPPELGTAPRPHGTHRKRMMPVLAMA